MSSWNHRVHRMPLDQEESLAKHGWTCSARGCEERAKWNCCYDYVTGRAGRVSWAERRYCDGHARRFAEKHGLDLVEEPVRSPKHATDRLFDELRGVGAREGTTSW